MSQLPSCGVAHVSDPVNICVQSRKSSRGGLERAHPTALSSQRSKARVRAFSLGNTGESLNHRAVFLKGLRGVSEARLWSVLNAIRAPSPVEHFLRSQTLEWK